VKHGIGCAVLACLLACSTATAGLKTPAPNAPIPRDPSELARTLAATKQALARSIDNWRSRGESKPPQDVTLNALYAQRIELVFVQNRALAQATLRRLPRGLASEVRTNLIAKRDLWRLTPVSRRRRFRTGRALPPVTLLGYYRSAERRFGVAWNLLAAVNFVESAFNKLRNNSATGAQGPMQFTPATWRAYGLGGDVRDPHDAIMGAANYLHANGAPRDNARALYRYNPSRLYVDALLRYTKRIRTDPRAFYDYYSRQVFVHTRRGLRRITGPGLR
jgi:membrane-bound lytic murein transglycosylase B